jgi:hypothetical protein
MIAVAFADVVTSFLCARGIGVEGQTLRLDSLDYMSLLLHVESTLDISIDDGIFFSQGLPDAETLEGLCQRLNIACHLVPGGGQ